MGKSENSVDYLQILEEVKKQYQQYVEASKIYELTLSGEEVAEHPPSHEHPLTTNKFRVK